MASGSSKNFYLARLVLGIACLAVLSYFYFEKNSRPEYRAYTNHILAKTYIEQGRYEKAEEAALKCLGEC